MYSQMNRRLYEGRIVEGGLGLEWAVSAVRGVESTPCAFDIARQKCRPGKKGVGRNWRPVLAGGVKGSRGDKGGRSAGMEGTFLHEKSPSPWGVRGANVKSCARGVAQ